MSMTQDELRAEIDRHTVSATEYLENKYKPMMEKARYERERADVYRTFLLEKDALMAPIIKLTHLLLLKPMVVSTDTLRAIRALSPADVVKATPTP